MDIEQLIDLLPEMIEAFLETMQMIGISTAVAILIGLPLGVILFVTDRGLFWQNLVVQQILSFIVNVVRSIPYIILLVLLFPITGLLVGPLPADTLFYLAQRGDYDGVIAMYHDQGHAPIKVLGIDDGVNITIGLPIIRTSVDHGTAFDIAGKNIADEQSMVQALMTATKLANTKSHKQKK